ncbi:NLR family CARD domain-containing protein 3-like [Poeciliopsis prolifica]|uniref:NLR family CARD domain-containing protein 3-like n=1 Tax=Poeciliopsis prolifica TaxID=188132 RepID=UPI002414560F|nr:NLR family CARD domain-containing protein 3-like [Poeciliopsis prolifica]
MAPHGRANRLTIAEAASLKPEDPGTTVSCEDVFEPRRDEEVRTLVTKGAAGIGKTVLTQKYTLDWAEGKANHNIQFIFPFTFRELNLLKSQNITLVGLIHHFFPEIRKAGICSFEEFQIMFIFDGLDELQPPLDFHYTPVLTDATEPSSVHTILVNLIRGKLLPSARLWITTTRGSPSDPIQYVDSETEIRGFTNQRKEEYFRKRLQDKELAILDQVLKDKEKTELPNTLTELYIHFLVVQVKQDNAKKISGIVLQLRKASGCFHWLSELNDHSLEEEIQQYLSGEVLEKDLTSSQWLFSCNLSQRSCIFLVPMLTAENSCLRELDLIDNDLHDEGVDLLSYGLRSPTCRLEVLR